MRKTNVAASCVILCIAPLLARADDPGTWYLQTQIGYLWTDHDRHASNDVLYGLGLGHQFPEGAGVELNVLRSEHNLAAGGHLDLTTLMIDGVYSIPDVEPFTPFMLLGAGVSHEQPTGFQSKDSFAGEIGTGYQLRVLKRNTFAFNLAPQFRLRWVSSGFPGNRDMVDWYLTLGLQWVCCYRETGQVQTTPAPSASAPPPAPLPLSAPPSPTVVIPPSVKEPVTLRGVSFELNSATLTHDSNTELDAVAADLVAHPGLQVELQGHTDSSGSTSYNLSLSQRRAESVRDYLIGRGVVGTQVSAKGYGEAQPVADNSSAAGRAQNRRVVMAVLQNPGKVPIQTQSGSH